jgi:hypothetical protein
MSEADDLQLGAKLARMEVLFNAAIKSSVTDHALEWLAAAQLLLRVADDDADVAREAISTPAGREAAAREFEALSGDQRKALVQRITAHWAVNRRPRSSGSGHAAEVLGFDPETIAPDAVALVAATYLSEDVRELAQVTEQEGVAKRLAKP